MEAKTQELLAYSKELLASYGQTEQRKINGRTITLLPTCDVPFDHLLEENWRRTWNDEPVKCDSNSYGHFRFVWNIERLYDRENGEKISLYVKHPERVFTAHQDWLENGRIWWGGSRSGKKCVYLRHSLVEEQTIWQAIYLLELHKQRIPAEVPLAIVEWPSGSNKLGDSELILHDVEKYSYDEKYSYEDIKRRVEEIGFITSDMGYHNMLKTFDDKIAIIDVNRWLWPPHTDDWRDALVELVKEEVKKIGKK